MLVLTRMETEERDRVYEDQVLGKVFVCYEGGWGTPQAGKAIILPVLLLDEATTTKA
jgi:hypothetical protein